MSAAFVTVVEVAPRDGLQNEAVHVPVETKVTLVDRLSAAGFRTIEVTSFVSATAVPQLADAVEVMARIRRAPAVRYTVLTPNWRGFEAARAAGADGIVVFGSASETFSQRNIRCSIAESLDRFAPVIAAARAAGIAVRGTVSCALGCPFEGEVAPAAVAETARALAALGAEELSIADTIGVGTPARTAAVLDAVLAHVPAARLNLHLHDTHGRALENLAVALDAGVRSVDASTGGVGGCPFAPGATGNVATESVLAFLEARGYQTGIDLAQVRATGAWLRGVLAAGGRGA